MTLPSRLPQQRHHVIIFDEDWLWLVHNYGPQAIDPKKRIGVSCAIRELIHARVKELRAKQVAALDASYVTYDGVQAFRKSDGRHVSDHVKKE